MDVLKRMFGDWRCFKLRFPFLKKPKGKPSALNKYEYYVYKFQSIVIWEHPPQTLSCVLLIQLLFWMIVNLCWKFYGIIFTLLLVFCTHDVWTEKIWPEIRLPQPDVTPYHENLISNPRILTTNQIEEYFNNVLLHAKMMLIRFRNLRNSHPEVFCSIFSASFGLLTVIGCTISGIWLLYMMVMTIFLSPGFYIHVMPQSSKASLKQYLNEFIAVLSSVDGANVDEDDEYVPKLSEEKLDEAYATVFHLNDASNDFLPVEDKDDLASLGALPSFDDSSLDELDRLSDVKMNLEFSESSSVSSEVSENIKFQGAHFDNDVGGQEEEDDELDTSEDDNVKAFLPGPQYRRKASDSSTLSTFVSSLTFPDINQLGKNLFTNMMASSSTTTTTTRASQSEPAANRRALARKTSQNYNTDDEFEFVNESDLN